VCKAVHLSDTKENVKCKREEAKHDHIVAMAWSSTQYMSGAVCILRVNWISDGTHRKLKGMVRFFIAYMIKIT